MADADPQDGELLQRYRSGDLRSFDLLVDRYEGRLLAFARSTLPDASAAEDVVQEAFLRLIRSAPELGSNGAVGAWLFRVCRNLAYDTMKTESRERKRRERVAQAEAVPPGTRPEDDELHARLRDELERLPAKQREVVRLKVLQGLSYREIAEVTGLKTGYIGWLVHTGLNDLTTRLSASGLL